MKFRVYQKMYLGEVEVPEGIEEEAEVIDYMNAHDCWPEDFLEPVDTSIEVSKEQ